jgi:hypothetical protein
MIASPPELLEFARALARAHVARDIAAARDESRGAMTENHAHADLRPLL